jgi:Tfp pilus assembly protein PilN
MADWFASVRWQSGGNRYFHLELSTRHRAYVERVRLALIAICAVMGFWISWNVGNTLIAWRDLHEIQGRLDQVRAQDGQLITAAQAEGIDLSDLSLKQLPAEVSLANQLLAKRNFSWTQFLSGLEEAIPPRVSIRGVRLDPGSAMIHITGAAATLEDVTALTLSLQTHPVFHNPVLGKHFTGGDGLVEFDLRLKYRAEGA